MKKLIGVFGISTMLILSACGGKDKKEPSDDDMEDMTKMEQMDGHDKAIAMNAKGGYGIEITTDNAMDVKQFVSNPTLAENYKGKISGVVNECCKSMGCWVTLDMGNGESMMVQFRDDQGGEFFVPKDFVGKQVVVNGEIERQTLSVEEQKHLAEDAGKNTDVITNEKKQLIFIADGVMAI